MVISYELKTGKQRLGRIDVDPENKIVSFAFLLEENSIAAKKEIEDYARRLFPFLQEVTLTEGFDLAGNCSELKLNLSDHNNLQAAISALDGYHSYKGKIPQRCRDDIDAIFKIDRTLERAHLNPSGTKQALSSQRQLALNQALQTELDKTTAADLIQINILLEMGAEINTQGEHSGWTAAHVAAVQNNFAVMQTLQEKGADFNRRSNLNAKTSLFYATEPQIVNLMLAGGASLSATNKAGEPAWQVLISNQIVNSEILLKQELDRGSEADGKVIQALIEAGASVYTRGSKGWTPAAIAIRTDNHQLQEFCSQQGVDFRQKTFAAYFPIPIVAEITVSSFELTQVSSYELLGFVNQVNENLKNLNQLIEAYNQESIPEKKLNLLNEIYREQKRIDGLFPTVYIEACQDYREKINVQLLSSIKEQFFNFNLQTAAEHLEITTDLWPSGTIQRIIANMAPQKANRMIEILSKGANFNKSKFENLFLPEEPGYMEFRNFLSGYSISFLGGENSKNFEIKKLTSSERFVLKVENRLEQPKSPDIHLRERSLKDVLTPITVERQIRSENRSTGKITTRTLLVTEYCEGGDLLSYARKQTSDDDRTQSALTIYSQMGEIIEGIRADGCVFPDMKNSNWLIGRAGSLKIADSKSFLFTDKSGRVEVGADKNRWHTLSSSKYMDPPEFGMWELGFNADKIHSYMLGKNLYQFLTGCDHTAFFKLGSQGTWQIKHQFTEEDFNAPVFQTEAGKKLKELIQEMVTYRSSDRITVQEAISKLHQIKAELLEQEQKKVYLLQQEKMAAELEVTETARKDCRQFLNGLELYKLGHNDREIDALIREKKMQIKAATTQTELAEIKEELQSSLLDIKEEIRRHELQTNCELILQDIEKYKCCKNDVAMKQFIKQKREELKTKNDEASFIEIEHDLFSALAIVKDNPVIKEIQEVVKSLRVRSSFFTVGMQAKASRIEAALANVPIMERGNIVQGKIATTKQVLTEMASHRTFFGKKEAPLTKDGAIDEKKAAQTYKLFKGKFADTNDNTRSESEQEERPIDQMDI
ncbi:serine/threonine protein kinase [Legionella lansingensis]|uniref:Serine/threonine protein kinase n=1 Tax=Legionella lansingensis TaxID=45067 RepID=A0A0W0VFB2_9GAMM|nr:ankyrin repeat domain-containing protein [Legionella lansingensis]KTD18778.1 serine/threonine protein kinase [Legionella lansingensis]SNV58757.1 serine/threonine protein kinase [Legionella lansingensis]